MAKYFHAAFVVFQDDKHIITIDTDGVALAAIQGLYQLVREKECELANQQSQNTELRKRVRGLEARLRRIESMIANAKENSK